MTLQLDVNSEFKATLPDNQRISTTVRETSLEFGRLQFLAQRGVHVCVQERTLLAEYVAIAGLCEQFPAVALIPDDVSQAYRDHFGVPLPYNWTSMDAGVIDVAASHPAGP